MAWVLSAELLDEQDGKPSSFLFLSSFFFPHWKVFQRVNIVFK